MRVGPLNLKWLPRRSEADPYWDLFVRTPPVDPNNLVAESLRHVTEGNVFPIKTDVHSPQIMSSHVKEFARFLGADLCGVAPLGRPADPPDLPFGIVVAMAADYDMREAQGIGGQAPMLKGAFVTFVLGAWIRESGYRATRIALAESNQLAVSAGLAGIDSSGRLLNARVGPYLHIADILCTDMPLALDAESRV
jgi:hypothetical protein